MNRNLIIRGRRFEKIHIVRHADPVAGFCALVTYALNDVRKALENNWLPVINYDDHINHYFFDPKRGNNVWDYYFEPVMDVNYEQIEQWLRDGEISQDMIHTYPPELVLKWHNEDPERLCTFWGMERPWER